MEVKNLTKRTCHFDEYLLIPGYSYSGIKNEGKVFTVASAKMQLGTKVHQYLLEPEHYDHSDVEIVKPLAMALKKAIGPLIEFLEPEAAYTADFCHLGFTMPWKGRIDLCIPGRIVVDIKITDMPIRKGIEYFGYDKQLSGYATGITAKAALILSAPPKNPTNVTITNIPICTKWWEYQVLKKGEVL